MEHDTVDHLDEMSFDEILSKAAIRWAEMRKNRNEIIGEDRAEQELAFREKIVSEKSEKLGKSEKYFWITVNPRLNVTLPQLIRTVQKAYKKKWIQNYAYVYETTKNNHNHSHGLVKATYESARARKEFANSFKDICDVHNVHCFKFVVLTEEQALEKYNYMLGKKKLSKLEDVDLTKKWREENLLKDIYYSEGPLILLGPSETVVDFNEIPVEAPRTRS